MMQEEGFLIKAAMAGSCFFFFFSGSFLSIRRTVLCIVIRCTYVLSVVKIKCELYSVECVTRSKERCDEKEALGFEKKSAKKKQR